MKKSISHLLGLFVALACNSIEAQPRPLPAQSRLGINLAGPVDWNTEHPFVDVFRLSRAWISQTNTGAWATGPALDEDTNGWITSLQTNCYVDTPMLTDGHAPNGNYVCLYDGQGTISFWGAGAAIVTNTPGRIVVNVNGSAGGLFLRITSVNPTNYVQNIRLLMPGTESTYLTQPFTTNFLAHWSGFNTIRFMSWLNINGSTNQNWADRARTNYYNFTDRGVPLEVIADLCNRLKANAWINIPAEATDAYVTQCATLLQALLSPSLKVYVEYSNEVWNGGFQQNTYATQQGVALHLGNTNAPWEGAALFYSRRAVQIFQIFQNVFGGTNRLARVLAWQAAADPTYWTDGLVLSPSNAWQHCDALAIAPYITFSPSPGGTPLDSNVVTNWSVDEVLDYVQTNCLPQCLGWVTGQQAVAAKYGLPLVSYEAGQSLVGVGGAVGNNGLTTLLEAANRDPRMGTIYSNYMNLWRADGGRLMCLFESCSAFGPYGSWGLLEAADEPASSKFNAAICWNAANAHPLPQLKASASQNGSFVVQMQGEPDESYLIQSSPNLVSWEIINDTATDTNGLDRYTIDLTGVSAQFYRALPQ